MTNLTLILSIVIPVVLLGALLLAMYVKAPPSVAYILSGLRKEPRVLIGTGGFKVPIIERLDKTFLGQISVFYFRPAILFHKFPFIIRRAIFFIY